MKKLTKEINFCKAVWKQKQSRAERKAEMLNKQERPQGSLLSRIFCSQLFEEIS